MSHAEENISMKELHERFRRLGPGEVILDVRTPEEFAEGHVPGSRNIPHEDVRKHIDELGKYKRVYIHCRSGGRAKKAYETLTALGLTNITCITGSGMEEWSKNGFPIAKNS